MSYTERKNIERHIKTHSERSAEDHAAVDVLRIFLRSNGKINTDFSCDDKWPNTDGTFEFVSKPYTSRKPEQNFFVQIKGTHTYTEKDGGIKYLLKSLAFPAFMRYRVTFDPGILFVVINPDERGCERVFWKYMSVDFLHSLDFNKESATIYFAADEEIENTEESIDKFCDKLEYIASQHSFVAQLDDADYSKNDIYSIIKECDREITECIDRMEIYNESRDDVSKRMLTRLKDISVAALLLNALNEGYEKISIRLAWERSLLSIETKYLGVFYKALKYVGYRIPMEGQSERLMLKYYDFLWQIRASFWKNNGITVLRNLEKFPLCIDNTDKEYYQLISAAVDSADKSYRAVESSRFYVQKKTPFFVGKERYYEVTLQLAGVYATKYNRITAYTKENISTNYSVQISYVDAEINLWDINTKIKVITNWKVSLDPVCLNKLAKILKIPMRLNSKYREYIELMNFLTRTGINFLDLIDLQEVEFYTLIDPIYNRTKTSEFRKVLVELKNHYSSDSQKSGRNVIRYLLQNLREETIENVLPTKYNPKCLCDNLSLSSRCFPFEKNPFISNLAGSRTSETNHIRHVAKAVGYDRMDVVRPYLLIRNAIKQTGEIYFENGIAETDDINAYNAQLDWWERKQGYSIKQENGFVGIELYEKTTTSILEKLVKFSHSGNKGQRQYNQRFIRNGGIGFSDDPLKIQAVKEAFVESRLLLIYGAAGTGKTTLINYISNLIGGQRKLFLTKTHTALQNLKRRIVNPGPACDFLSIDSFTKKVTLSEYDIIFIDECSTIDNQTMKVFLEKLSPDTFLVLAGDIYQIESIDFGNWFFYAKDIIKTRGSKVELLNTWRTDDQSLISLWDEVRKREPLITEKLVIDGPFSENIGSNVWRREEKDEVILCLNYDGKFGLNNMNNYFQTANKKGNAVFWKEWSYKPGDPILFNETKRFPILHNNLKGHIVDIIKYADRITFTVDVEMNLTEIECKREDLEFIDALEDSTRIRFTVYAYESGVGGQEEEYARMRSVIPFQLAYAVSIHKAQGLEYDSVKVIIPNSNSEKITHGIFYTAITRAKKRLKIYWSAETMDKIVKSFSVDETKQRSLEIVRSKLGI